MRVSQEGTLEGRLFQVAGSAERKPRAANEMLQCYSACIACLCCMLKLLCLIVLTVQEDEHIPSLLTIQDINASMADVALELATRGCYSSLSHNS